MQHGVSGYVPDEEILAIHFSQYVLMCMPDGTNVCIVQEVGSLRNWVGVGG